LSKADNLLFEIISSKSWRDFSITETHKNVKKKALENKMPPIASVAKETRNRQKFQNMKLTPENKPRLMEIKKNVTFGTRHGTQL
jgi:hypothetical protein